MAKITVRKSRNYTTIDNNIFKNKNLSLKARGLLTTMLSLPDDWDYTVAGLCLILKDGKTSIQSALKELEENGYLVRTKERSADGRFQGYNYDLFETPKEDPPLSEKPLTDFPSTENQQQLNTNILNTDKENINALLSKDSKDDHMYASCNGYPITKDTLKQKLYCPKDTYTEEQLNTYIHYKLPLLIEECGGLENGTKEDLEKIILKFYSEYNKYSNDKHPVLSDESFKKIIEKYDCPPDTMYTYGVYGYEDYQEMIQKYFTIDFGKYGNSDFGTRIPIKRLLSHFISDSIREHIYRQITGL